MLDEVSHKTTGQLLQARQIHKISGQEELAPVSIVLGWTLPGRKPFPKISSLIARYKQDDVDDCSRCEVGASVIR